ncbi:lipoate--protein ligase family protein [Lihuaxuella thermophila]|uniref:Octanoyltransferase LipM n=1 Tax=Lihuaxuella thermophila TaxID=1173111 RepID=A0A1H8EYY9_9BACL|nr:biotin/lipoate A/B protein ligase family protein [Lihuaxuella thermophila]SEN24097.1 lipoate-protein ligase A [Lihuaxuella thermophila]
MRNWRFLPYQIYSSAYNMALDEAIMTAHREGKVPPTLRFYGWNPATLSIGYFQRAEKEVDLERLKEAGLGFVRRMTGGRAVLHDQELTYSVIVSEDHPLMPSSVSESYRVISQGLLEGFRQLGMRADLSSPDQAQREHSSAACFDSPSDYELVIERKKVAGSAQTRQRGVILQHGSILLNLDTDLLFRVLRFPSERVKERLKKNFAEKAVAINLVREKPVSMEQVIEAFYTGFAKGMGLNLIPGELTRYEQELAEELVRTRYGNDEWNFRR